MTTTLSIMRYILNLHIEDSSDADMLISFVKQMYSLAVLLVAHMPYLF